MVKARDKKILGVLVVMLLSMSAVFISALSFPGLFSEEDAKQIALKVVPGEITKVESELENNEQVYEVDVSNNGVQKEVIINQLGEVISVSDEKADQSIKGTPLERASQAALNHIGEGRVTDSEIGDEEGYYEIEITLNSGKEVDVHLDRNYNVLSTEYD